MRVGKYACLRAQMRVSFIRLDFVPKSRANFYLDFWGRNYLISVITTAKQMPLVMFLC